MNHTVVVTGANSGVGFEATRILASQGHDVILLCRSPERGARAVARIREESPDAALTVVECDLGSFESVRSAATEVRERVPSPRALINNAGVYRATLERTTDGFERTMGVNHLGHFLLTRCLEPTLRGARTRIINVASKAHENGRLHRRPLPEILTGPDDYRGFGAYSDSKLANVLFTRELARRWETTVVAVHPGLLATAIWDRNRTWAMRLVRLVKPLMGRPATGGQAVARLVTAPDEDLPSGGYFDRAARSEPTLPNRGDELAGELWDLSAEVTGTDT